MSILRRSTLAAVLATAFISGPAAAHFQLIYNPEVIIEKPGSLPLKLIFWHPMENGHAMDMGKPESFTVTHRGKTTDLSSALKPITFKGASNESKAYEAKANIKRNGDYVFTVIPAPYYEESEDIYIQQITKAFVNKGGVPTDWAENQGLKTEIVPLNKPYNVITGSTFSGQLLSNGKPVANAEIEVEYMAAEPVMEKNMAGKPTASAMPGGAIVAMTDANGIFTFGIPKAGFWGFAALGSGPDTEFKGKELSQDAVIWIRAFDLK